MIGQLFAGRFEILAYLGQGGYGVVWQAHDDNQDRNCALKLFFPGIPVFQAFHEAQLLTALGGPYILPVYNADVYMDVAYLATALCLGSTEDEMGKMGVPAPWALSWMEDGLVGLDVCHRRGLAHRDIKPSNLFLPSLDRAQLGDFGVAALMRDQGEVDAHGDPKIRSPEMYSRGMGDARSDIYSAGVTLYALLAGNYPMAGSLMEIQPRAIRGDYEPLENVAPHVPRSLLNCVQRAMSLDPNDRYQSAEEMATALSRVPQMTVSWRRIPAHAEHHACWEGERIAREDGFGVCVEEGARFQVTTFRQPTGRRIRDFCRALPRVRLLPFLRRVFRELS